MIDSFTSNGASTKPAALHAWNESYLQRVALPEFSSATDTAAQFEGADAVQSLTSHGEREPLSPLLAQGQLRDQELAASASRAICGIGYAVLRKVQVQAHHGQITLTGRVPLYYFKQLAQASLRGVPGVHYVRNELNVG